MADDQTLPNDEDQRLAEVLYDKRAPVTLEPGEFYSVEAMMKGSLDPNLAALGDAGVLTFAQQAAERKEFSALMRATGLDALTVGTLIHDRFTAARLANLRDDGTEAAELALEREIRANEEASRTALRELYGAQEAEALQLRAVKWMRQHPKLNAIVNTRGLGSQPALVLALVEHVRRTGFR